MGKAQFQILGEELAKLEAEQQADMDRLFYPFGRDFAWDRINAMCEVSPAALGEGPIDRSPNPFWKNRAY